MPHRLKTWICVFGVLLAPALPAAPASSAPAAGAATAAAPSPPDPDARARLDAVRAALDTALASLHRASTDNKGNTVEMATIAIDLAKQDVAAALAYLLAHPEAGQPVAAPSSAPAAFYLPADLTGHDVKAPGGQWKSPRLVEAIEAMNGALLLFTKEQPGGGRVFTMGEAGGYRDKIMRELAEVNAYCLAGIDLADDISSVPTGATPAKFPQWSSDADLNFYFTSRFLNNGSAGRRGGAPPFTASLGDAYRLNVVDNTAATPTATEYVINAVEFMSVGGTASHLYPVVSAVHTHQTTAPTTRGLTDFETKSLALLRSGVEVSVYTDHDQRIIVGAVRAQASCLGCHSGVRSGDLLGAFTYRLTALKPLPAKP